MMTEQSTRQADEQAQSAGERVRVKVTALVGRPATLVPAAESRSGDSSRGAFADPLDRLSEPVKGKYADLLPSSDDFIRDKRREAGLEDRPS